MAYVRQHGNQLAIVHGERDPQTGKVHQQVLFTICSKAEAAAATGKDSAWFRRLLESHHRQINFNWTKISAAIKERSAQLPDGYEYREAELIRGFREQLRGITRQLLELHPYGAPAPAEVLRENRIELEFLSKLIEGRLKMAQAPPPPSRREDEFFWVSRTRSSGVPSDVIELMGELADRGESDKLEALARLFVETYEDYADGYNYLGDIARERGDYDEALACFETAATVGRRLFPKRLAKKHYWVDLDTRPYIRALRNLASTLHLAGEDDRALAICDQLAAECDDAETAQAARANILLCAGRFEEAREAAQQAAATWPELAYVAAFASCALGEKDAAVSWFLHGLLNFPRTGDMLLGLASANPQGYSETNDHNRGVAMRQQLMRHLNSMRPSDLDLFARFRQAPQTVSLIAERCRHEARMRGDRAAARRFEVMGSRLFAFDQAPAIFEELILART